MTVDTKPILCLDFDGVCHSYDSGWRGALEIPDEPVQGLFEFLHGASEYFRIYVFSSRSHHHGGIAAMKSWFLQHSRSGDYPLPEIHFPTTKPPAFLTIDDRVIRFEGRWPSPEVMTRFKPWNKA